MPILYSIVKEIDPAQLGELFLSVKWISGKYPDKLAQAMANSHSVITAWDGDNLVGLMNCLSDGVMTAYFHYLLVRPVYQGQGIGRTLVQMMFDRYSNCLRKVLIADKAQVGFYEKCGFEAGTGTMALFCDLDKEMTQEVL
jgi:ribosomal protein S18 acetylase RimI-like enzyme